jgi:GT2 family glycosyltransferase
VKEHYPDIEHIFIEENLGFTGGNNRGIQRALEGDAPMILILNNDVRVPQRFLEPLVEVLKKGPGIVGPKIFDSIGKVWCAGGRLAFHQNLTCLRGFGQVDNGRYNKTESIDYMPACCLLVSREVFETIGLLDDAYFCYLEDVDFCQRARKSGFSVTYCPSSSVVHHFSFSTGGGYTPARKYMNALNSVRYLREHGTFRSWLAFWLLDVLALPLVFVLGFFQGRAKGVMAKGRGILDGLSGRTSAKNALKRYLSEEEDKR